MEKQYKEVYFLDKEGFVPTEIFVGKDFANQKVILKLKLLSLPEGKELPETTERTESVHINHEGFVATDPCWSEFPHAKVEVSV